MVFETFDSPPSKVFPKMVLATIVAVCILVYAHNLYMLRNISGASLVEIAKNRIPKKDSDVGDSPIMIITNQYIVTQLNEVYPEYKYTIGITYILSVALYGISIVIAFFLIVFIIFLICEGYKYVMRFADTDWRKSKSS